MLPTESPSAQHPDLDLYASADLVAAFVDDQLLAVQAVRAAAPDLARAVDAALPRIQAGGRLLYAGAGTSGRLGVLDSVELYPTFSWPYGRAQALLAGGQGVFNVIPLAGVVSELEEGIVAIRMLAAEAVADSARRIARSA